MWKMNFFANGQFVVFSQSNRGRRKFSYPIDSENGSFPKWRWKKGAGGMTQMMFRKEQTRAPINFGA